MKLFWGNKSCDSLESSQSIDGNSHNIEMICCCHTTTKKAVGIGGVRVSFCETQIRTVQVMLVNPLLSRYR